MLRPRYIFLILFYIVLTACAKQPPPPTAASLENPVVSAYSLDGTEVRNIHSKSLQRDYQLFVSLPTSYSQSKRSYPVLFVTDANYAFPVIRSIAKRVSNNGKDIEEFILIGLSYAQGDTPEYSRRRDYTPTAHGDKDAASDMPGRTPMYGEAEGYRKFIADEVFPFVAQNYRADMSHKIYAGHSYGGLLGAHILLTEPTMFDHYIIGSPSLWFDHKEIFSQERAYANAHNDMPANVFMAVASFETVNPRSSNPRYNKTVDMVRDLSDFDRALKSRHYPGLNVQMKIIDDEDHLTVFPAIITRGLMWALPPNH